MIALLLSNVSPAAAQPAWTGVVTGVSGEPIPVDSWSPGTAIDLVSDAAGNAIAMWAIAQQSIGVAHFSSVTKAWGAPVALLSTYSPAIAMSPEGDAIVVWNESSSTSRVRAIWYRASAATWSVPLTIATTTLGFGNPHVAVDARSNATAVWETLGPSSQSHVQAARYTVATGVWSAPVNVTSLASNGNGSLLPRVVVDASGHATVVFWTGLTGGRSMASRSSADGTSWSSPQALRLGGQSAPALTIDAGGNVFAVWRIPESPGGIAAARYVAAAGAWNATGTLSTAAALGPQVVVDDAGNATAAWVESRSQGSTIVFSSYSASSGSWSVPQPIVATNSTGTMQPGLAVDGNGTVTAVWARYDTVSRRTMMSAARRASGQSWTAPVMLAEINQGHLFAVASRAGDVTVLSSNMRSTRWASTGAEGVSAPLGLTVTTRTIWNGNAEAGAPLTISWSAPQTGLPVSGYRLEAGTSYGLSDLAVLDVGAATQFVTTVPSLYRVFLRVRALSGAIVGPPSSTDAWFYVHGMCSALSVPSGLIATVSGSTVAFTWQAASGAVTYVLEAGSAPSLANLASMNIGSAQDSRFSAIAPPGTYYVRMRAANYCETSGASNEVVVTIGGAAAPGAPMLNTPVVSGNTVSLSWSAGSGGAPAGYTLTASMTPGGAPVATVPLSGASASFPRVPSGTYYLRLTATNAAGTSPPSPQVTLNVP